MQVRKKNEDFKSENEFMTDVVNSLSAFFKRFIHGWPRRDLLADRLETMPTKLTVGFKELETMKMFRSHQSIRSFLEHYSAVRYAK
jgi:hypothetical protein